MKHEILEIAIELEELMLQRRNIDARIFKLINIYKIEHISNVTDAYYALTEHFQKVLYDTVMYDKLKRRI